MEFDKDLSARQEARLLARQAEQAAQKLRCMTQAQLDAIVAALGNGDKVQIPGFGTFDSAEVYSLVYNGCYMLPCTLIALVIAAALYVPLKPWYTGQDLH